jgi:prevent-host-death family protein
MKAVNVRPITELKNRTKALIREVVESGQPVVITQNGKPQVVVMDAAEHDRVQDTLAMLKLLAQSVDSLARTGKTSSSADVRRRAKLVLDKARQR